MESSDSDDSDDSDDRQLDNKRVVKKERSDKML